MPELTQEVLDDLFEVEEETFECPHCGESYSSEYEAEDCCHACVSCGSTYSEEYEAYECCRYQCRECGEWYDYEESATECCGSGDTFYGTIPYLPDDDLYEVKIPEIPGRPARLCSIEQELAAGGTMVARLLYEQGISDYDSRLGYHHGATGRGTAHVEEDGSLPADGGEVVYDRFNLSLDSEARKLGKALTKIRQLRDLPDRPVGTSYSAGTHVHVSARAVDGSTMTPKGVAALYELWSYSEDMLYSLSAAGWQRHRQPVDAYSGYCKPVPKGEATPRNVFSMMRSDRYFGLNFQRLFGAVSRCSCGAATMGDWASCDCGAFDGATVEWRVFNSSTRPATIHGWIVFAQAMTAYAEQHELGTLPQNSYGSQSREEKREVFEHLMKVLPLTDGERKLLGDLADRSPGL